MKRPLVVVVTLSLVAVFVYIFVFQKSSDQAALKVSNEFPGHFEAAQPAPTRIKTHGSDSLERINKQFSK